TRTAVTRSGQEGRPRGHVRGRARSRRHRDRHVRVLRRLRSGSERKGLRRRDRRSLAAGVRRRARLLPAARAGGGARARAPARDRYRRGTPPSPRGGGPVVRRAAIAAMWGTGGLLVITAIFSGVLRTNLFKGVSGLVICFAIALVTYAVQHLTRGTLSGNGRFGPYGVILGAEGCIRLLP